MTSAFITLFVESFSAIFENITYAHYKQKRPCKVERNVRMGKKRPIKAKSRLYESGNPVNLFAYKQIFIFNRILL